MEALVTLTLSLPTALAQEVLALVAARGQQAKNFKLAEGNVGFPDSQDKCNAEPGANVGASLGDLLDGSLQKVALFILAKRGRFYNDELAKEMQVDDPFTSAFLGHLTRKLRKIGVSAEGHRRNNWYTINRVAGRTLINVRADVLKVLREQLG